VTTAHFPEDPGRPSMDDRRAQLDRMTRLELIAMHDDYRKRGVVWTRYPVRRWRKDEIVTSLLNLEGYGW
jgi:hypothetical protein